MADDKYGYAVKRKWRQELWDAIAKRCPRPEDARVVYLAGPTNFDAWEAEKRGFRRSNLIAVERDPEVARALRKQARQVVVTGDFWEVVIALGMTERVDVVLGDFVSGITNRMVANGAVALSLANLHGAVVAVNLQRGRETKSHPFAHQLVSTFRGHDYDTHRGKMLVAGLASLVGTALKHSSALSTHEINNFRERQFLTWFEGSARGTYPSESGKLLFDSVVFVNKHMAPLPPGPAPADFRREFQNASRALAAAKATRTLAARPRTTEQRA